MAEKAQKDLAQDNSSTGKELTPKQRQVREMVLDLQKRHVVETEDTKTEYVHDLMADILSANTLEELFNAAQGDELSGPEMVNKPFLLRPGGIKFYASKETYVMQGGFPFYARVECVDYVTNRLVHFACGGATVVVVLYALETKGFLDKFADQGGLPLVITEQQSGGGNDFLRLMGYGAE